MGQESRHLYMLVCVCVCVHVWIFQDCEAVQRLKEMERIRMSALANLGKDL